MSQRSEPPLPQRAAFFLRYRPVKRRRRPLMGIVNRRNAVVGWLVLKAGKRAAKKKAQSVGPEARRRGAAVGGALAALGGLLLFWKKKKKSGGGDETA